MKASILAFMVLGATARPAWSQPAPSGNTTEAKHHFQEGIQSAQNGDLPRALKEFEAAYAVQPHFTVLYNIGQAHSALGHAVEAVAAFERYLAQGGEQVQAPRREEVRALITTNRQRVGLLRILTDSAARGRIWLDGSEVGEESVARPLPLTEGSHSLLYVEEGCSPVAQAHIVPAGKTVDVRLSRPSECARPLVQVKIDCEVPDVEVEVSGVGKGRTPLETPLLVPIGDALFQFRRPGYAEVSRRVSLGKRQLSHVGCEQLPLQPLPAAIAGRLVVKPSPEDAEVLVDGKPFTGDPLPIGRHRVVVARDGFVTALRFVSVGARKTTALSTALTMTPEQRARDQAAASRRKRWGIALGGAGVVFAGTAGGLFAWNNQRYSDWRDRSSNADEQANVGLATAVQRVDDVSVAFALLGAGLTATGAWLFFSAE
jgi:hypothetical protein